MDIEEFKNCVNQLGQKELNMLKEYICSSRHIIMLGNGGSNAITCHLAQDYTKNLKIQSLCFGDSSRLTCYANDYGWEHAYTKFIEHFAKEDTLVILISSSGNSQNILNAAEYCRDKYKTITLSGFDPDNKLRTLYSMHSLMHFYVPSNDYGIVECIHELILHSVI